MRQSVGGKIQIPNFDLGLLWAVGYAENVAGFIVFNIWVPILNKVPSPIRDLFQEKQVNKLYQYRTVLCNK